MAFFFNELHNYQNIPRELVFDSKLSDRARFVYCYMACKPSEWQFFLEPMAKEIGYSVETLRKYIKELITSGWIESKGQQNKKGVFGAVSYVLKACNKKTVPEIFRHDKKHALYNIDNKKNKDDKKYIDTNITESINNQNDKQLFIEKMYKLYPTKCPKRNASLGKSHKDKQRIAKLLKIYSMEDIELVFKREIEEKYDKQYMQNFSTFLNNFPDPTSIEQPTLFTINDNDNTTLSNEKIIINGQIYR